MANSSANYRESINSVIRISTALQVLLRAWQEHTGERETPIQQVLTFAYVAGSSEPVPMADLIDSTGVSQSSVSRNVATLGPGVSPSQPGYGLMEAFEDPYYRRRKLVRLTSKGLKLRNELQTALTNLLCRTERE
jgi:DNA-binding MarR family transcriptional regulator